MTLIQTKQKRAGREQRNKYKPRTETSTKQEQTQEQHLTIRHAGRPADYIMSLGFGQDRIRMLGCSFLGRSSSGPKDGKSQRTGNGWKSHTAIKNRGCSDLYNLPSGDQTWQWNFPIPLL